VGNESEAIFRPRATAPVQHGPIEQRAILKGLILRLDNDRVGHEAGRLRRKNNMKVKARSNPNPTETKPTS
jgi:hypothetical protein